jgi:pyruvate kinase
MNIKIFCTLGPASLNRKFLKFSNKKIDLLRLNMSHININHLEKIIFKIRKYSKVPICIDTEGAQIRTKVIKAKRFKKGEYFTISRTKGDIKLYPDDIFVKLKNSDILSFGFEGLQGRVLNKKINNLKIKCTNSGYLETNKGVHIDNRKLKIEFLTKKDFLAIEIGKKNKIVNYALSFTNNTDDMVKFNKILPAQKKIFKLETREALKNFRMMTTKGNFFLLDRGDMSKDLNIEEIPIAQRFLFKNKRKNTKIAIATNFLESMIEKPFPTRAEANDIYSSLEMGANVLVLAAETAIGKYPKECVEFLLRIIDRFKNKKNY